MQSERRRRRKTCNERYNLVESSNFPVLPMDSPESMGALQNQHHYCFYKNYMAFATTIRFSLV
jgi:hypothetical protein